MSEREAKCSCGQVSVRCSGDPVFVSLCHCLECQRRTGSTYGIAAFFDKAAVIPSGEVSLYTRNGDSGYSVEFHFCPKCGGTVFWYPSRLPDLIAVGVGAFADPDFPKPGKSVYQQHRHGWVTVPGEAE